MRNDLDGRLPIVYNGRTAEEWYTLYCQATAKHQIMPTEEIEGGSDQPMRTIRANADLVAAAPELLEACKSFLDMWHRAGPMGSHQFEKFDGVVRQCRMAVEKATGEVV